MFQILRKIPWELAARIILIIGLAGPGIALTIAPGFFSATGALALISFIVPPVVVGVLMLATAILVFSFQYREIAYLMGFIMWGILTLCAFAAFFVGAIHSVLLFGLPIVCLAYAQACKVAIERRKDAEQ